jgi:hypothetical protein
MFYYIKNSLTQCYDTLELIILRKGSQKNDKIEIFFNLMFISV